MSAQALRAEIETLRGTVASADAARQTHEARAAELEQRLDAERDRHARELRATTEDLELKHRAERASSSRNIPPPKGPRALLEPNHSHFLFVDAGPEAEGQFGKEIELRAAVEDHFCRVPPPDMNGLNTSLQSVMILLVVAGGVGTLTTVLTILEKRRPVVVLPSSGGAAKDIFDYVQRGVMPTNTLDPNDKGYAARASAVQKCIEVLPKIKEAGAPLVGL